MPGRGGGIAACQINCVWVQKVHDDTPDGAFFGFDEDCARHNLDVQQNVERGVARSSGSLSIGDT